MSAVATRLGHGALGFALQVVFFAVVMVATLLWGWIGLAASAVVSFVVQLLVRRRLAASRARRFPPRRDPMTPRRWYPKVSVGGLLSGLVLGVGGAIALQQFGIAVFDLERLIQAVIAGIVAGIVVPSLFWAITVARYNARIRKIAPARPAAVGAVAAVGWIVLGSGALLGLGETPAARADLTGSCEITVNGQSLAALGPGNPVEIADRDAVIRYTFTKPAGITSGWGGLRYMGADIPVFSQGDDDVDPDGDGPGTDSGELPIGALLTAGTGLYEGAIRWTFADGTACAGSLVFDLVGDTLATPAGAGAVALVAGGAVGLLTGAAASAAGALTPLRGGTSGGASGGTAAPGAGGPPPAATGTRTVVLSGAEARAALDRMRDGGPGTLIELPESERWDLAVDVGEQQHRSGWVGTHGQIDRVGAVVEGENGEITISLDVTPTNAAGAPAPGTAPPAGTLPGSAPTGPAGTAGAAAAPTTGTPTTTVDSVPDAAADSANPADPGTPPDATVTDAAVPDTAVPDTAAPDTAVPDTAAPGTAAPGTPPPAAPPPPVADPGAASAPVGDPAALDRLRDALPDALDPVIDALEPLASGASDEAVVPASLLGVEGLKLQDGGASYSVGPVVVDLVPTVTPDGGITIATDASLFGFPAKVPDTVAGWIDGKLGAVNDILQDAGVRLDTVQLTPEGVRITVAR